MSFNFTLDNPPADDALSPLFIALRPMWNAWKWWQLQEPEWQFQPQYAGLGYVNLFATPPETEKRDCALIVEHLDMICPKEYRFKQVILQMPTNSK